jgi:hypothetical protein
LKLEGKMFPELAGKNGLPGGSDAPVKGIERNGDRRRDRNTESRPVFRCAKHGQEVHRVLASVMDCAEPKTSQFRFIRAGSSSAATMKPMIHINRV